MISVKNLSKAYGQKLVLESIDLALESGKVYGIAGENGAGKTTLFRCIAGLETCLGKIESGFKPLKDHLGFLQTDPVFLSRITGWEHLKLLCTARNIRDDDFEAQNIFELPLNQYAETYSSGMKKKLALLGILLQRNQVFILDEPFNGVDIHSNILISEIIGKLKRSNKIVLISSHIFSTLSEHCDLIHLLKGGHIAKTVERGQFAALENEMKDFIIGDKIDKLKVF